MTKHTMKSLLAENEELRLQLALLRMDIAEADCIDLIDAYTLLFAKQIQTGHKTIAAASPNYIDAEE